jgi:hypothetical protein
VVVVGDDDRLDSRCARRWMDVDVVTDDSEVVRQSEAQESYPRREVGAASVGVVCGTQKCSSSSRTRR